MSILNGCLGAVPPPRSVTITSTGTTEWSEYFDSAQMIAKDKVVAHLIITLGKERLPKDALIKHELVPNGHLTKQNYRDGLYEAVSEIYFTNKSTAPVTIELISIKVAGETHTLRPKQIKIPPGRYVKSDPVVDLGSVFWKKCAYSFTYLYGDSTHTVEGIANRVRVSDIGKGPSIDSDS